MILICLYVREMWFIALCRYVLQSARAEIVNNTTQDQLSLLNTPPSLNYNYDSGVLSIIGAADIDHYIAAVSSIVYINMAEEPINDVKVIRITITDSPLFNSTMAVTSSWPIANSSTSNSVEIL